MLRVDGATRQRHSIIACSYLLVWPHCRSRGPPLSCFHNTHMITEAAVAAAAHQVHQVGLQVVGPQVLLVDIFVLLWSAVTGCSSGATAASTGHIERSSPGPALFAHRLLSAFFPRLALKSQSLSFSS